MSKPAKSRKAQAPAIGATTPVIEASPRAAGIVVLGLVCEHADLAESVSGRCWLRFDLGDGRTALVPASIEAKVV